MGLWLLTEQIANKNRKGLKKVVGRSRKQSKNHAVERILTEEILGNLCG